MDRPSPDELLKHAGFLRALAFRLVGDDARADDLVQDAYVAALERPPQGSVRAWLGAVVRNLAGKVRRSEDRRGRREHAAARPEPLPPADDIAARIALHRSLVQAVDALDEPYRSTIVLRFFYDLKPQEVAARLGIPVETVRTRTRRALELLRGRIDKSALFLALLPLPALKTSSTALTLGVLMATKRRIVFALVLLLLATGGMFAVVSREGGNAVRAREIGGGSGNPDVTAAGGPDSPVAGSLRGAAGGTAEPEVILRGLVLLDGTPVAGAQVALHDVPPSAPLFDYTTQLYRGWTGPPPKALDETRTDPEGRFTVRSPYRAAFTVEVLAPGAIPAKALAYVPLSEDLTIRLKRGAEVVGRVVDEAGAPVPRALVRWREWKSGVFGETSTDADGTFRTPGNWILVAAPGFAPVSVGVQHAARIVLKRGGRVTGVVKEAAGAPVPDAIVLLATGSAPAETRTDAQGRYELRLGEGHLLHAAVLAPGKPPFGSWTDELALPPRPVAVGKDLTFDITLPGATRLRGTVVEGEVPVSDAVVTLYRRSARMPVAIAEVASDAQGAFAFDAVPAGSYDVRAVARALAGKADVQVTDGEEPPAVTIAVTKTGRIEGTVVGALAFSQVGLEGGVAGTDPFEMATRQTDVDALGRFVFEHVAPAEAMYVHAFPATIRTETFAVRPGETVRVTLDTSSARMLRGRVVDAEGRPVAGALVAALEERSYDGSYHVATLREVGATTAGDGRFAVPLPEEAFLVAAYHEDAAPVTVETVDPDAELEITLQPGRVVAGRVVWPGGVLARDIELRAVDADLNDPGVVADTSWREFPTGEFELRALRPGMVRIVVRHDDGVAASTTVETGTRDLVIELRKTLSIRGAIIDRAGRPVSAARVTTKAPGKGDRVAHSTHQGRFEIKGLEAGTYDLHLEPGTQSDWHPPKLTPFMPTVVERVAAGTGDVVVEVDTGGEVSGVVQGPDGRPVAKALVAALGRRGQLAPTARTGTDGRFKLTGITGEHTEVLVVARGLPTRAVPLGDSMEIQLQAGETLRLRYLAPDGTPVAGQWISASAATPAILDRSKDWIDRLGRAAEGAGSITGGGAQTDAEGRAEITGLLPGEYRIYPVKTEKGIAPVMMAQAGEHERTVHLEPACSIKGTVVDRDGNPLGSVKDKYWISVAAYRGETQIGFGVAGEDGSFEIEGLTSGTVRLTVGYSGPSPGYEGETTAEAPARDVRVVATR